MPAWIKKTTGSTQASWGKASKIWIKKTTGTTQSAWGQVITGWVKVTTGTTQAAWRKFYIDNSLIPTYTVSPSITVANYATTNLSGSQALLGTTLTGNKGTWSSVNGTITYSYLWFANNISTGITGTTFSTSGYDGQYITFQVTATNKSGYTVASSSRIQITKNKPVNTSISLSNISPKIGDILSINTNWTSTTIFTNDTVPDYYIATFITNAGTIQYDSRSTSSWNQYTVLSSDSGHVISAYVTAYNTGAPSGVSTVTQTTGTIIQVFAPNTPICGIDYSNTTTNNIRFYWYASAVDSSHSAATSYQWKYNSGNYSTNYNYDSTNGWYYGNLPVISECNPTTSYTFYVQAINSAGTSSAGSANGSAIAIATPSNPTITTNSSASNFTITATFGSNTTAVDVYYGTSSGSYPTHVGTITTSGGSVSPTGPLAANTTYYYQITPYNSSCPGSSISSSVATLPLAAFSPTFSYNRTGTSQTPAYIFASSSNATSLTYTVYRAGTAGTGTSGVYASPLFGNIGTPYSVYAGPTTVTNYYFEYDIPANGYYYMYITATNSGGSNSSTSTTNPDWFVSSTATTTTTTTTTTPAPTTPAPTTPAPTTPAPTGCVPNGSFTIRPCGVNNCVYDSCGNFIGYTST